MMAMLPCLRCGGWTVAIPLITGLREPDTFDCMVCSGTHYLAVKREGTDRFSISYQVYTLRYPLEFYDEGTEIPRVRVYSRSAANLEGERETFSGPVVVYPRRRLKVAEIAAIWKASVQRYHLCGRKWRLGEHGRHGWHIDHVIPNIGGGAVTESDENLRVACATCNLRKGRGYTERMVKLGLGRLIAQLHRGTRRRKR